MDPLIEAILRSTGGRPTPPQFAGPTISDPNTFAAPTRAKAMQNNLRTALKLDDPNSFGSKVADIVSKLSGLEGIGGVGGPTQAILAARKAIGAPISKMAIGDEILQNSSNPRARLQELWNNYGVSPGKEGSMRWEIPDDFNVRPSWHGGAGTLEDMIDHPELFSAYPQLATLPVIHDYKAGVMRGGYTPGYKNEPPLLYIEGSDPRGIKSVVIHEAQHGVQDIEKLPSGGNPDYIMSQITNGDAYNKVSHLVNLRAKELGGDTSAAYNDILQSYGGDPRSVLDAIKREMALDRYNRRAGEVEARNVSARMFDPYLRRFAPEFSEDVPRSQQILTGGPWKKAGAK